MVYISCRLVENTQMIFLRCPKFASLNSIVTLTLFFCHIFASTVYLYYLRSSKE